MCSKKCIVKLISILIQVGCLLFVVSQSYKCLMKFLENPKGTEIRIVEGNKDSFPDITICPLYEDEFEIYSEILKKCNLTYDNYFNDGKWIGNGSEKYCSNPEQLFEEMTKHAFDDLEMTYVDYDGKPCVNSLKRDDCVYDVLFRVGIQILRIFKSFTNS